MVGPEWAGVILRTAVPLAILAGCQTLTMLTGGIDLSVGAVASMSGFVVATLVSGPGTPAGIVIALAAAALAGLVTGIGVGVFRVHPLIMTLGMSLVVLGLANVWQLQMVQTGTGVPEELRWLGSGTFLGIIPHSLLVFVPLATVILLALRRTGYGRLLYAIGDNPIAARLSGARAWQVIVVLYVISALMAAVAGFLVAGLTNIATVTLADSYVLPAVAAAVIGGTSIMGGRGGYGGTIVGALILTVLTSLLSALGYPEAVRQILFGSIIVAVAAAYTRDHVGIVRPGTGEGVAVSAVPGTRHLGLDLGATNLKWAVVEHAGGAWSTLAHGQVPTRVVPDPDAVPTSVTAQLAEVAVGAAAAWGPVASVGIGVPGPLRPGHRRDSLPHQRPGAVGRASRCRPRRGRGRRSRVPDQRRASFRARGAAPGRRTRRLVHGRAHARDGRRGRVRDRRPRPPGPRRDGRRDRPPDHRSRRAVVRLRQPRLPGVLRPRRPDRGRLRDRHGRGGGPRRAGRRRAGAGRAWPTSGATWASGSPT